MLQLISCKMSERVGKIGLNAGTPWSLFAENTAFEDSEGITVTCYRFFLNLGPGVYPSVTDYTALVKRVFCKYQNILMIKASPRFPTVYNNVAVAI